MSDDLTARLDETVEARERHGYKLVLLTVEEARAAADRMAVLEAALEREQATVAHQRTVIRNLEGRLTDDLAELAAFEESVRATVAAVQGDRLAVLEAENAELRLHEYACRLMDGGMCIVERGQAVTADGVVCDLSVDRPPAPWGDRLGVYWLRPAAAVPAEEAT